MNTLRSIPLLNVVYIFGLSCVANTVKKVLFSFSFFLFYLRTRLKLGLCSTEMWEIVPDLCMILLTV